MFQRLQNKKNSLCSTPQILSTPTGKSENLSLVERYQFCYINCMWLDKTPENKELIMVEAI